VERNVIDCRGGEWKGLERTGMAVGERRERDRIGKKGKGKEGQ